MLERELAGPPQRRIAALRRLDNEGQAVPTTGVRVGRGRVEPADQELVID
jgi:hypothetical protein